MSKTPNILVFQTDDHARWALPCYGGTDFAAPTLDRLAARGVVMEDAYTPTPVCSPARASFFTGLMPSQHGVRDFISSLPDYIGQDWLQGIDTLPQELQRAGYRCGLSGKWHIGRDSTPAPGFDHWHAMSGAFPIRHQGRHELSLDGEVVTRDGILTEVITDGALRFLDSRTDDRPFFLYVGYYATHSPWSGHASQYLPTDDTDPAPGDIPLPEGYELLNVELPGADAALAREARRQYRAAVAEIDAGLARILAALPEGEDTIIVYTSDHGLSLGQRGIFGKGNGTWPQNLFDENVRIPMILSRPGHWPEGTRQGGFCDHTDLHALLRASAGLTGAPEDGRPRPGRNPLAGPAKPFQVCEYGTVARLVEQDGPGAERRAGGPLPDPEARARLDAFYAGLDCQPPWDWHPPEGYAFNPTDAWKAPRRG